MSVVASAVTFGQRAQTDLRLRDRENAGMESGVRQVPRNGLQRENAVYRQSCCKCTVVSVAQRSLPNRINKAKP